MEYIEDLCYPDAPKAQYQTVVVLGTTYRNVWLPSLPCPMYTLQARLSDAWAVLNGRATAVQWPHQRQRPRG